MAQFIYKLLRYTFIHLFFREIIQKNKISILLFHNINQETAVKVFTYLKNHYNIISLQEYITALKSSDNTIIPYKTMIITFDDGYAENYHLLPILEKLQIPVTFFICSAVVGSNRQFWFDQLPARDAINIMKLSVPERNKKLSEMGIEISKEKKNRTALSDAEIQEMISCRHVDIQSHTRFHPNLPMCPLREMQDEIENSRKELESTYAINVNSLSYPNGDYNIQVVDFTKKAGYTCGLTVDFGYNDLSSDPFTLKRLSVNDTSDINELIIKSCGFWQWVSSPLKNFLRAIK
jgi:peptidoglycan/xylan/chitin deacetylase (PgdA/CDA1 family)